MVPSAMTPIAAFIGAIAGTAVSVFVGYLVAL